MATRLCIICDKIKSNSEFNDEHCFPDAIGGKLIVKNVCEECNGKLNRKIDKPFLTHPYIGYLRTQYPIKSRRSFIPNPFKSYNRNKENLKGLYIKDKQIYAFHKFRKELDDDKEKGTVMNVEMDEKDYTKEKIDKLFLRFAKSQDVDISQVKMNIKVSQESNEKIELQMPNNLIILELAKIAYEFTANELIGFSKTIEARSFANMLLAGKPDKQVLIFTPVNIRMHEDLTDNHHFVHLSFVEKIGLIAVVQIFKSDFQKLLIQIFLMSSNIAFSQFEPKLIVNNIAQNQLKEMKGELVKVTPTY